MGVLRRFWCLAAGCLLAIVPATANARWLRADTHGFVVYSDGEERTLRRFALQLEQFDAFLHQRLLVPNDPAPVRLTVYLVATSKDVSALAGDRSGLVAGFYAAEKEGSYAVGNRERATEEWQMSGQRVLLHEYAHHFMYHYFTNAYPAWYIEGFAEFLSTATFTPAGNYRFGDPPRDRAYNLLTERYPIEKLLFEKPGKASATKVDLFYGRSWLLVHMLTMSPARDGQLTRYLAAIAGGTSNRDAAMSAFGDLARLDDDLDRYMTHRLAIRVSAHTLTVNDKVEVTTLDEVQSRLVELSLWRRSGQDRQRTLAGLRALSAAVPGNADVWYELAEAELAGEGKADSSDDPAALARAGAAVDRALALDSNHVRANVLKSQLVMDSLERQPSETHAQWSQARSFIKRANARDPEDPLALFNWYESFRREGLPASAITRKALAEAFYAVPESSDLRSAYAIDLAEQKDFTKAITIASVLANDPHAGDEGRKLLDQIIAMRDAAGGGAKAAGAPSQP